MADIGQPRATDAVPVNPPPVTPEERLEFTRQLLDSVHFPQPMAPGFDPVHASPEQLREHGLPPRPSEELAPEGFARWAQMVTALKGCELVRPGFKIIQRPVGGMPRDRYEARKWTTRNWAGAVIDQSVFDVVAADWMVPMPAAGRGHRDAWYSSAYVGIDGYRTDSDDVLAGGTGHDYYRADGGSFRTYAWFEWYPAYPVELVGFPVRPGDCVQCDVWGHLPHDPKKGSFHIHNITTNQYASIDFDAPDSVSLRGDSAEWIVEGDEPEANFHVVEFHPCFALKTDGKLYDLRSATTLMSTCDDGTVCTATINPPDTLVVVYGPVPR